MKLSRVSEVDLRAWRARVEEKTTRELIAPMKERNMKTKNTIQHDQKIQAKRDKDAKRKREKRAALKEAVALVGAEIAKPASERVKLDVDEPIPYRATVVSLAKDFSDACLALTEAERVFDQAVAYRAKTKCALDAEVARLANEVP